MARVDEDHAEAVDISTDIEGVRLAERARREKVVETLVEALATVMDSVDYKARNCSPTEMVAAVLQVEVIDIARAALSAARDGR